jgi:hypothetical protein
MPDRKPIIPPTLAQALAQGWQPQDEAKTVEDRRRRLEILDRQHAAKMAEQDRLLDEALGESRR